VNPSSETNRNQKSLASDASFPTVSGQGELTGSGNYLGHDVELRAQWVLSQNMDFDVGYDHWFKGSYFDSPAIIAQMPIGGNKDTDYFYLQVRVRL
jgi:hypothetical protein